MAFKKPHLVVLYFASKLIISKASLLLSCLNTLSSITASGLLITFALIFSLSNGTNDFCSVVSYI